MSTWHDECGVFGIWGHDKDVAPYIALGLHALQHRGQESAGIVTADNNTTADFHVKRAEGHVRKNFTDNSSLGELSGNCGIGHVRYSTSGGTFDPNNIQPIQSTTYLGKIAISHNGNLTNANKLKQELGKKGSLFHSTSDTEVFCHLVATSGKNNLSEALEYALNQVDGAFSLTILTENELHGIRDSNGVRPLVLGEKDGAYIITSETCALDIIGATYIRDILPGEWVTISNAGIQSRFLQKECPSKFCIFEYIYFSRPDSNINNKNVYEVRKNIGKILARENPLEADIIVPIPDSGIPSAIGYAQEANIPFDLGIIRNHYVGRTFIQPSQQIRDLGVRLKHNVNPNVVAGKRVVLVDDSIVRGTTSLKIVAMVRKAGAKEVHMRIASPPTKFPCFYGVDTPSQEQLMAHKLDVATMAKKIGVDSLAFISLDGLYQATGEETRDHNSPQYCDACFSGDYPIDLYDD